MNGLHWRTSAGATLGEDSAYLFVEDIRSGNGLRGTASIALEALPPAAGSSLVLEHIIQQRLLRLLQTLHQRELFQCRLQQFTAVVQQEIDALLLLENPLRALKDNLRYAREGRFLRLIQHRIHPSGSCMPFTT
jgi:hypothetical protein